ncbi:hypothetical protein [Bradyrhizobium sp. CCBAU 53340]|uniref:hypothetical protein n=1 Tax=Bradyrhizobium sp. CCBAU 53340 TaxID=1325112 RepID=UPI001FEDB674|nr:hypothetical protein [Bradyrhizobium sp. CCBAU 53340]
MSAGSMTALQMLAQRLQIVQEMSAVQSRTLLNRQLGGGAEFEIEGSSKRSRPPAVRLTAAGPSRMRASAYEGQMPRWRNAMPIALCWSSALRN